MANSENSQLYSQFEEENNIIDINDINDEKTKSIKKSKNQEDNENTTKNKNNKEEVEVELVLKNNNIDNNYNTINNKTHKNDTSKDKTKANELTLPKLDINCSFKPVQENNINISSGANDNLLEKNLINGNNINNNKETSSNNTNNNSINESTNNDNTKTNEEKLKEKEEKLLSTFNKLKTALMHTCLEIEENLNRIYYPEKTEEMMNISHINFTKSSKSLKINSNLTPEQKQKEKEYFQKIKNYKLKIKSAQNAIDLELKINKVDELESLYLEKKAKLELLKKENIVLKNIKVIQEKDNDLINYKNMKKEALISMNEKIKKLKDEIKIKKDYSRTIVEKIKSQNDKINELQNKCDLINQNIEYYKKKQIQEVKKQKEEEIYKNNNKEEEQTDIYTLKKSYEEKLSKLKVKEDNLAPKVKEQNIKIKSIIKHNEKLNQKIKEIMIEINSAMSQIISFENKLKRKENQIYDRLTKKNNNTLSDRKPFHIGPINNNINNNHRSKKIFDYQKYLKEYEEGINKNKNRLFTSADTNLRPKTLNEIEKLKTDIQQAIKNNELDDKIKKIIIGLKLSNSYNKSNNNINEEEDDIQKFLKKNEEINFSDRYNFYVTEGANLPIPIKVENINNNLNSNY